MSSAREQILARLERARTPGPPGPDPAVAAEVLLAGAGTWSRRAARFRARATAAAATVAGVDGPEAVPGALADYLGGLGLPPRVRLSATPPGLQPGTHGGLRCETGTPRADGETVVTGCLAAVADEGVIVLASGEEHAPESAFLAATHVVVVEPSRLIDSLEALWSRLRTGERPRMLNLVLGPSRTADLGVPSRLGAHGPLRVHVILINDAGSGKESS